MWETVKLGDVCDLVGGGTPSKKNNAYYDGDIPWATVRDMNADELCLTEHKITELGLNNSSSKIIPENNVVIASRVGLGKVCILRQDTAINQDLRGVLPKRENQIDIKFLFYWFKTMAGKVIAAGRGATVQGVTLPFLNSLPIPLPSLAEQKRIVAKLDAAFAEIDMAIAAAEAKEAEVEKLKASLLSASLSADAVMWKTVKLREICEVFSDGNWIETKHQSADGLRLIQTGNVKSGFFVDRFDKARFISEATFEELNCKEIFPGDILVSRLPEPVGRACIIPTLNERAITAVDCTIIRVKKGNVLSEFLNYYMQSPSYFTAVQEKVTGATRQRISRKNLGEINLSLPPLAEQQRIVAKLDAAFAEIDSAKQAIQQTKENHAALKAAILAQELAPPSESEAA